MHLRKMLFFLILMLSFLAWAEAGVGDDLVKKQSAHGVQETIDRLEALVTKKGMTVFARIDHRANAESIGKTLADSQVLIFGAPAAGTLIMQQDPRAGLDLPMRVLAYEDADGKTQVLYHNPQGLKAGYDLEGNKAIDKVEGALDKLTGKIIE